MKREITFGQKQQFDLAQLVNGIYFIKIESEGKQLIEKIMKQ